MTNLSLDVSEVLGDFPDTRIALVVARGLAMTRTSDAGPGNPELERVLGDIETEALAFLTDRPLAEIPELQVWRSAYKAFGVKKTSYRSSVERLLKQIQQGRGLPRVNNLVDCYNAISVRHRLPVGADDLAKLRGNLAFRPARDDDDFFALGAAGSHNDPPKPGEIVYADAEKLLCRRWNWYQDARSATTSDTRSAALTVQCLGGHTTLEPATEELCDWLSRYCGAQTSWVVADANTPSVDVETI